MPEEVVLIRVPIGAAIHIWVRINHSHTLESRSCFESGKTESVANKLSVVVLDDRGRDEILPWWEVNQGGGYCARIASLTTAVAVRDSFIDGSRIIGRAIA